MEELEYRMGWMERQEEICGGGSMTALWTLDDRCLSITTPVIITTHGSPRLVVYYALNPMHT